MRTYEEILADITSSCVRVFINGTRDIRANVIEAETKIYITELQLDYCERTKDNLQV